MITSLVTGQAQSNGTTLEIVVYNPLAWKREEVIRIPETDFRTYLPQVSATEVFVQDSAGKEIESQLLPLSNITSSIRKKHVKAYIGTTPTGELKYWLAFLVYVPPIGFSTYIVSRPKQAGHASTISNEFRSEGSTNNNIEVGQGNLTLLYSANEGKLSQYVNIRNLVTTSFEQSYSFYSGNVGDEKDSQVVICT
ncbi:unnamed protein product [Vicia faba]|uniref:Lysosomal alpha-mannosidase-like central domain-containing protein n=1 Tax=Vicia faba TaxID=3906 RepID=A0AAV0Z344_VICFA|nr:unnamed protein product [Vicia faba]